MQAESNAVRQYDTTPNVKGALLRENMTSTTKPKRTTLSSVGDRATDTGNMYKRCHEVWMYFVRHVSRQTDIQTHWLQYFITTPPRMGGRGRGGKVMICPISTHIKSSHTINSGKFIFSDLPLLDEWQEWHLVHKNLAHESQKFTFGFGKPGQTWSNPGKLGQLNHKTRKRQQAIKVIWHKAASPPHIDGSLVFARLRQSAPPPNTCSLRPTWVHTQMTSQSVESFLQGSLLSQTNGQPYRQTETDKTTRCL